MDRMKQSRRISLMKKWGIKRKKQIKGKLKKAMMPTFDWKEMFKRATPNMESMELITTNGTLKTCLLLKEPIVSPSILVKNIRRTRKKKNIKKDANELIPHDDQLQETQPSLVQETSRASMFSQVLESVCGNLNSRKKCSTDILSEIIELSGNVRHEAMVAPVSHRTPIALDFTPIASDNILASTYKNKVEKREIVKGTSVQMHLVSNFKYIFVMKHPCSVFIRGKLRIKVIFGSLEVLGYTLEERSRSDTVYSPRGSSQLSLLTRPCDHSQDCQNLQTKLEEVGMDARDAEAVVSGLGENDCLLLTEEASSALSSYINAQFGIKVFPSIHGSKNTRPFYKAEKHLQCLFELPHTRPKDKLYTKGPNWDGLADDIISSRSSTGFTSTVVCGGKGVGKSTLLRFLVNRSLAVCDQVLYLDFDPGQAEFTVPGCVSAVIVKEPLLGPNYTHHKVPERMVYVGDVDVSRCPSIYLSCAHYIIDYCQSRPELMTMPWFINTMGFTKGLGIEFMVSLIRLLKPNNVVQIDSHSVGRNFPNILDAPYIKAYQGSMNKSINTDLNYSVHSSSSIAERKLQRGLKDDAEWGFRPQQLREIMILSYLSQVVNPPDYSLADILPYVTSFSKLKLCVCHESVHFSQFLSVINGNLVALCSTDDENVIIPENPEFPSVLLHLPISPCLGFGIVRGIDMEEKLLFMISPLSDSEMARVNCLIMGSVSLPERVYMAPLGVKGQIPYVVYGQCQETARTSRLVNRVR